MVIPWIVERIRLNAEDEIPIPAFDDSGLRIFYADGVTDFNPTIMLAICVLLVLYVFINLNIGLYLWYRNPRKEPVNQLPPQKDEKEKK